ncbi:MAG: protein kinase [Candidatus Anammoximicrobium sp.]|nr:protein kinase [Candidatus Anammoximicrobium sp.]
MIQCPACKTVCTSVSRGEVPYQCSACRSRFVGPYCDLTRVGGGGMGDVYRARRPDMGDRPVAIKIPKVATDQLRLRFEREIAASARLQHENIVRVFDRGDADGVPYLVMEFVDGRSLRQVLDAERPLACARVARIIRGIAAGLTHAGAQGIVNRDVKPDNVLLDADDVPKILDYGLALLRDSTNADEFVTREGILLGTTAYLAPEQAADPHSVTIRADVYALGCSAFQLLTGHAPFHGDTRELCQQHATAPRPSVGSERPDVAPELDHLIQRMMAVRPDQRPVPVALVIELDQLIPRLSHARPRGSPTVTGAPTPETPPGEMDVLCPECGERFRLSAAAAGKMMFCTNEQCGARFKIRPAGSAALDAFPVGARLNEGGLDAGDSSLAPLPTESLPDVFLDEVLDEDGREPDVQEEGLGKAAAGGLRTPHPLEEERPAIVVGAVIDEPEVAPPGWSRSPPAETTPRETGAMPPVVVGQVLEDEPASAQTASAGADSTGGEPPSLTLRSIARTPAPEPEVAILPASAIIEDEPAVAKEEPRRQAPQPTPGSSKVRLQRKPRRPVWKALGLAVLVMGIAVFVRWIVLRPPDPETIWTKIQQEDYQLKKWKLAEEALRKFAEDFPDHSHAAEVPFFLSMCDAGRDIHSETGDPQQGLGKLEQVFLDYRDKKEYELYCSDLYMGAVRLIERFVALSGKTADPRHLDGAQRALELLQTVAQAMQEEWVPKRTQGLEEQIAQARTALERTLAQKKIFQLVAKIKDRATPVDELDPAYEQIQGVLRQFPPLAKEAEIVKAVGEAYQSESARVEYFPVEDNGPAAGQVSPRDQDIAFVVWGDGAAAGEGDDAVFLALARGVLYAFAADGRHLWARRLGFDSDRLPVAIRPSPTSPEAFIAVCTLDNTLLALDKNTGQVLWEYRAGGQQELAAPLTVSRWRPQPNQPEIVRGLLPTASGEIHVLELARGKRIGRFRTGFPMTVGGTYDPETRLVFFPAERQRVFAIDPAIIEQQLQRAASGNRSLGTAGTFASDAAEAAGNGSGSGPAAATSPASAAAAVPVPARSVLFTGHPSGALRSEPLIVGQYLILTEASDLEHTKVRAFQLQSPYGFLNPRSGPLAELTLRGWSWFTPPATPDRITVVTDEGDLGVCGVNLDNRHEALYLLIQSQSGQCPSLSIREPSRALGIHSNEHLLWLMAGGTLQHWALDVLHQKVVKIWPSDAEGAAVGGIPLHEASLDRSGTRIYLATQSSQGREIAFSAVDADTGERLWQRQLGVSPAGDLIRLEHAAVLVDQTGRLLHLSVSASGEGDRLQIAQDRTTPAGVAGELLRLQDASGGTFLVTPLEQGAKLAVRSFSAPSGSSSWREIRLPGVRLQGRPAVAGDYLILPASDGRLHRLRWDGAEPTAVNELPFPWKSFVTLAPTDTADVYPLADDQILLMDGHRARCLKFVEQDGVKQWEQEGGEFLAPMPLAGKPVVLRDYLFLTDVHGTFYRVSRSRPEAESPPWPLPGKLTAELLVHEGKLVAVQDHRQVVCLSITGTPPELRKDWTSDKLGGRICGQPVPLPGYYMVTDESGEVTVLNAADGQRKYGLKLTPGAVPAAAAVLLCGRILVPLADGTLLWQPVTQTAPQHVAEAEP